MIDESQISCCDVEQNPEKIIHKRRSSIFRLHGTVNQLENKDKVADSENCLSSSENKGEYAADTNVETFNLKEYVGKLKQERKDWQQEYKNRKIRRKNLAKQKINLEKQGQPLDINILTESERVFLMSRPNYEHMCKSSKNLSNMALKISILNQLVCKLNKQFMKKMEDNISRATRDVIKMVE